MRACDGIIPFAVRFGSDAKGAERQSRGGTLRNVVQQVEALRLSFAWCRVSWRTIDSAPRDGTAVLVHRNIWPGTASGFSEECNGHNTYVAQWWSEERDGQGAWICYMDAVLDPECPVEPTHWQPLPEPPEEMAAARGETHSGQGNSTEQSHNRSSLTGNGA